MTEPIPQTKRCRDCAQDIPAAALKCTHCDAWQNWRGALSFSIPVLSLLLAILSVVFSSGRQFLEWLTYAPKVDAVVSNVTWTESPKPPHPGSLTLILVNSEDRFVLVGAKVRCTVRDAGGRRIHIVYARHVDPSAPPDFSDWVVLHAKSTVAQVFEWVEANGDDRIISNATDLQFACEIPYSFEGTSFQLRTIYKTIVSFHEE
jgi:hypothetical protein